MRTEPTRRRVPRENYMTHGDISYAIERGGSMLNVPGDKVRELGYGLVIGRRDKGELKLDT